MAARACHGLNGKGGRFNFNYQGGGAEPILTRRSSNYTRDELRKKIEYGVPVVGKDNRRGRRRRCTCRLGKIK